MTVKQENELLKSFVVEMSAHLTHQLSTSQNQLVKLILDMAPKWDVKLMHVALV